MGWTPEQYDQHCEDLAELAQRDETALFALKEMERQAQQFIDLQEKLNGQTALAAARLKETEALKKKAESASLIMSDLCDALGFDFDFGTLTYHSTDSIQNELAWRVNNWAMCND